MHHLLVRKRSERGEGKEALARCPAHSDALWAFRCTHLRPVSRLSLRRLSFNFSFVFFPRLRIGNDCSISRIAQANQLKNGHRSWSRFASAEFRFSEHQEIASLNTKFHRCVREYRAAIKKLLAEPAVRPYWVGKSMSLLQFTLISNNGTFKTI